MRRSPHRARCLTAIGFIVAFACAAAFGGERWLAADGSPAVDGAEAAAPEVIVHGFDAGGISLSLRLPGVAAWPRSLDGRRYIELAWPDCAVAGDVGAPTLPVVRRLFVAPDGADVRIDVRAGEPSVIDLARLGLDAPIIPVQPTISMEGPTGPDVFIAHDPAAYARDGFMPSTRASITELGIVANRRLFQLEVHPVAYSAPRGAIALWPQMDIAITFDGADAHADLTSPAWLSGKLLNGIPGAPAGRGLGNYLIVLTDTFTAPIAGFVNAKTADGYTVMLHEVAAGTPASSIKSYIESLWGTPDQPDFILLVGDSNTIPSLQGGGSKHADTDLPHACMDGPSDWYPDIPIGRFPVRTEDQLLDMVDKVLTTDSGVYPDPEYVKRAAFIAGSDTASGNEETHNWVIEHYMDPHEYYSYKLYVATYGATTADVIDAFSDGVAFGVYYEHSGSTSWWHPHFSLDDLVQCTNDGMYSTLWSFSCNCGDFTYDECLGESFVREPNKGASAVMFPSTFIYWTSYPWHQAGELEKQFFMTIFDDEMTLVGKARYGAFYGLLDVYGPTEPAVRDYFEMYNLLGDPSMTMPLETEPTFKLFVEPAAQEACAGEEAAYTIDVHPVFGYAEPVTLTAVGVPAGSTVTFSDNPVTPPAESLMTVATIAGAEPGVYAIEITGVGPGAERTVVAALVLAAGLPSEVSLVSPPDGQAGAPRRPQLVWSSAIPEPHYEVQVATDEAFAEVVYSATVDGTYHLLAMPLDALTLHYWRVRGLNGCGEGEWSESFSFTTEGTPLLLLVDDDDNSPDVRSYYTNALDLLGIGYDLFDTGGGAADPTFAELAAYGVVVWFTGDDWGGNGGPTSAGENALAAFLDAGGCLFISSQDYYFDQGLTPFMDEYLGVASASSDVGQSSVTGTGSVFGAVGSFSLSYPFSNWSDVVNPDGDAELAFDGNAGHAAVDKDGGIYRTAFLGFPLEAIPSVNDRAVVLDAFISWCGGAAPPCPADVNGDGTVDVLDLLAVIAAWGNGGGAEDINNDGIVDVLDLLAVIAAWGDC